MAEGNFRPTVEQVARTAGVSKRTVFLYFDDWGGLMRAALDPETEWNIARQVLEGAWALGSKGAERIAYVAVFGTPKAAVPDEATVQ